jgi:hypothetical protein
MLGTLEALLNVKTFSNVRTAQKAFLSAQMAKPYDAFSTLHPANTD